MDFLQALRELDEDDCEGIRSSKNSWEGTYTKDDNGNLLWLSRNELSSKRSFDDFLGPWILLNSVILPKAGEVWKTSFSSSLYIISRDGKFFIDNVGDKVPIDYRTHHDPKGVWTRIYPPVEEK